jgi:hypothetical protein
MYVGFEISILCHLVLSCRMWACLFNKAGGQVRDTRFMLVC